MKYIKKIIPSCALLFISASSYGALLPVPLVDLTLHYTAAIESTATIKTAQTPAATDTDTSTISSMGATLEHSVPFIPNIMVNLQADPKKSSADSVEYAFDDITFFYSLPVPFLDLRFGVTDRKFKGDFNTTSLTKSFTNSSNLSYLEANIAIPFAGISLGARVHAPLGQSDLINDQDMYIGYELGYNVTLQLGMRSTQLQQKENFFQVNADVDTTTTYLRASLELL